MSIHRSRWFWCDVCDEQAINCSSCGQTSCSGPGCRRCQNSFAKARYEINLGLCPTKNEISDVVEYFSKIK